MKKHIVLVGSGFVAGVITGGLLSKYLLNRKYDKILDENIATIRGYRRDTRKVRNGLGRTVDVNADPNDSNYSFSDIPKEEANTIRYQKKNGSYIDYTAYGKPDNPQDIPIPDDEENVGNRPEEKLTEKILVENVPEEDVAYNEVIDEEEQAIDISEQIEDEKKDNLLEEYPTYEQIDASQGYPYEDFEVITYYKGDDTFVDGANETIQDIHELIGPEFTNDILEGKNIGLIANNDIEIVYEIEISPKTASEVVYGIIPEPETSEQKVNKMMREDE